MSLLKPNTLANFFTDWTSIAYKQAWDAPSTNAFPSPLYEGTAIQPSNPISGEDRIPYEQMPSSETKLNLNVGKPTPTETPNTLVPQGLAAGGAAVGAGAGMRGLLKRKKGAQGAAQVERFEQDTGINLSMEFTYMAEFGFTAKPIFNITARKKAQNVLNKKMSKIATTGKLSSTDPVERSSALSKMTKIKQSMSTLKQ